MNSSSEKLDGINFYSITKMSFLWWYKVQIFLHISNWLEI